MKYTDGERTFDIRMYIEQDDPRIRFWEQNDLTETLIAIAGYGWGKDPYDKDREAYVLTEGNLDGLLEYMECWIRHETYSDLRNEDFFDHRAYTINGRKFETMPRVEGMYAAFN